MRLDEHIATRTGSRAKAKRAIQLGLVKVNGRVVKKPSYDVKYDDKVEVQQDLAEKSAGYFKLKEIQDKTNLISKEDIVLDIGSSAGGFLLYASENASKVYSIEYSREFYKELKAIESQRENVRVIFDDVFTADLKIIIPEKITLILNDLTLDWQSSLNALKNALPLLAKKGRVLQVVKGEKDLEPVLKELEEMGLKTLQIVEGEKREKFVIAVTSTPR